jgi:hypothetical protein
MHAWFRRPYGWSHVGQASSSSSRGATCLPASRVRPGRRAGGTACSATVISSPEVELYEPPVLNATALGLRLRQLLAASQRTIWSTGRCAPTPTRPASSTATSHRRSDADSGACRERPGRPSDVPVPPAVDADLRSIRWRPSAWGRGCCVGPCQASERLGTIYVWVSPIHALRNRDHQNWARSTNSVVPFLGIEPWGVMSWRESWSSSSAGWRWSSV